MSATTEPLPLDGARITITSIYAPPEVSGIAPYTWALATALCEAGAQVRLVTGVPHFPGRHVHPSHRRCWWQTRTIDGIRVSRRRHWVPRDPGLAQRALLESSFTAGVAPTVLFDRADAVIAITPTMSGLLGAVLGRRRRPLGVQVQDLVGNAAEQSGTTGSRAGRAIGAIEYWLLRRAALVGVIVPRFGTAIEGHGVPHERIRQLPNFTHVETSTLTRDDARRTLGWPLDEYLVVHTGNMGMKQGLDVVCAAARRLEGTATDVTFVLLGDGNQRARLEQAAGTCSRLRFLDFVDEHLYPVVLRAADQLLLCEKPGIIEMSLPSKLTSYVASGRPIIASLDHDGITHRHVEAHGVAHVVEPGDADALLAGIRHLRRDSSLQMQLIANANRLRETTLAERAARDAYVRFAAELLGRQAIADS